MPNVLLDAALSYAKRGWPVFPCRADKTPHTKNGVIDATTDPAKIVELWGQYPRANIGLNAGEAAMMVLDLDPGSDKVELATALGGLPDTLLRAKTPRGGSHLYYSLKPGEVVSASASRLAPHVDVRSFHSYVLLPPSTTADGSYTWESEGRPAYRTDEMVRLANTKRGKSETRDEWKIKPDLEENVALAVDWLQHRAKISIQGQGGEANAYATAAMLRSYGISETLAVDLMWQYWNGRCLPPWTADDIDHFAQKVKNGYSYATSDPGNMTPAFHALRSASLFSAVAAEKIAALGANDLPTGVYAFPDFVLQPEPKWIVKGLLQEDSYSVASGRSGAGKSFCEVALALSIATGAPWLGQDVLMTGPVLYIASEGSGRLSRDVRAWCQENVVDYETLRGKFYIAERPARLNTDEGKVFLEATLTAIKAQIGRYPLYVVFDTLQGNMRGSVSDDDMVSDVLETVRQMKAEHIVVTLVAHTGRGHSETRGSTIWEDEADQVRRYTGSVKDGDTMIEVGKVKSGADGWSVTVSYLTPMLSDGSTTKVARSGATQDRATTREKKAEATQPADKKDAPKYDVAVSALVASTIDGILADNPLHAWSSQSLAVAVAQRSKFTGVPPHVIRTLYMQMLIVDNDAHANKQYDALKQRWRHVEFGIDTS